MSEIKNSHEIRTYSCPNCYLCGSSGEFLYQQLQDRLFAASGEWNLKKCTSTECGLLWLDPMPLEEDIGKAYETYYTHEIDYVQKKILVRLLSAIYHTVITIPSNLLGLRAEKAQIDSMYLANVSPGRLVEVGFGNGYFLNKMQLAGWEVEGVDFDPKAAEGVRTRYDINVHIGSLESVEYPDNSFDAITMSHVIEHVHNPIALLQECYRILKHDGYLIAVTPNINSWGHQYFKANWLHLDPPRHLHLFSPSLLQKCAKKAGFQNIETRTNSACSIGTFNASFSIKKLGYYRASQKPNIYIFLRSLILQYYELLSKNKYADYGGDAVLLCRKF
jgi:2-polyprenyl-3-methyl-5-hydroxy-6-metoxy-1,4-benzoquinol methylase